MSGKKKGGLAAFLYGTEKGKTIVNMAMSLGAAIVILGALFKIQHYPGASLMLIIGLCTESALFALGAIEPQHLKDDWSKVYPELRHSDEEEEDDFESEALAENGERDDLTVTQKLDEMLEEAKIGPELLESLGVGLRGLSDQAGKLTDMTDAAAATDEYVQSVRGAANSVSSLTEKYTSAANAISGLEEENREGANFGEQLSKMSSNLTELNSAYELQLRSAQETLENSKVYFTGLDELMASLNNSVDDAKVYSEKMSELSRNITSLNTVYGNMLTAMNPNANS